MSLAFDLDCPPVNDELDTAGGSHLYFVLAGTIPLVISVGVTVNTVPLQIVALMAVITAFGFTVTSTVNVAPTQLPKVDVGVTMYTAVLATLELLVRVPFTESWLLAEAPPVRDALLTAGSLQEYRVVVGTITLPLFTGDTSNGRPLQITVLNAIISGVGSTNTVRVKLAYAAQFSICGVTMYTAVCVTLELFLSNPNMLS
jgi:hypothetical protein